MSAEASPNIVNSGLQFCVDAANPRSDPGSGTTWTDIGLNANNGTLTNGPTYSSANGGFLRFDGIDDFISTNYAATNITGDLTISFWMRTGGASAQLCGVVGFRSLNTTTMQQMLFYISQDANAGIAGNFLNWNEFYTTNGGGAGTIFRSILVNTVNVTTGNWINVVATSGVSKSIIYVNGVQVAERSSTRPSRIMAPTFRIGAAGNWTAGSPASMLAGYYFRGDISQTSVYNRELSAEEILQNYNALKGRYGL